MASKYCFLCPCVISFGHIVLPLSICFVNLSVCLSKTKPGNIFLYVQNLYITGTYVFNKHILFQGPYSLTILWKVLCLILQIFLSSEAFECNTTSDWLNRTLCYIQICISFRKKQRMAGEYEARLFFMQYL